MGIAVLILLGAAIGWALSIGLRINGSQAIGSNALAGALGALVAPILAHAAVGTSDVFAGAIGIGALFAGALGAMAAVLALRFYHSRSVA